MTAHASARPACPKGSLLLVAAAAAGAAKAQELDGKLLALCADIKGAEERVAEIDLETNTTDDALKSAMDRQEELLEAIIRTAARTPEGVRAKAEVLRFHLLKYVPMESRDGTWESEAMDHDRLALSLCLDLLGEHRA